MKTSPLCNPKSIIYYQDWRIEILKNRLIRFEKGDGNFNDYPTQIVLNRFFDEVNFTYKIENELIIVFDYYEIHFNGDIDSSFIIYRNKKLFLNNDFNLKGTYSTVDGMDGERYVYNDDKGTIRDIGLGVCSTNGVALLDDRDSYCFDEKMNFSHLNTSLVDVYLFFYPNDYLSSLKSYYELSGFPPKLPKKVFGNWWSRYYAYSEESYLHLMDEYINDNIPFSVATIDMDWHYSTSIKRSIFDDLEMDRNEFIKNNKYLCSGWNDKSPLSLGWTGFTWNKKLFPNYEAFLKSLKERNMMITLNIHPNDGIAFYEDFYQDFAKKLNIDSNTKKNIPFDFTDEQNRNLYFKNIFNYYENKGVDFWWIDWQQGEISKLKGLKPIWLCNHYFYMDRSKNTNRPVILSRYCGPGGHRYPLGFSGDSVQSYDSLRYLVKTTSMASNIGFTYWSHDVGGHMNGYKDGEQFLKFVQFAVFSPIVRLHCSCEELNDKNPNVFLSGYGEIIKKYLRLRHQLVPYIYSHMFKTSDQGIPLLEPMYYHHPNDEYCYKYIEEQYYFASNLLVAPFVKRKDDDGYSKKEVYFPQGTYYDYKYGYKYTGNQVININREVDDMPVFILEGQFLILDHNKIGNSLTNPKYLDIITSRGKGEYILYEDNEDDNLLLTKFTHDKVEDKGIIKIFISGNKEVYQANRKYRFKLLNVFDVDMINVNEAKLINTHKGINIEIEVDSVPFESEVVIEYISKELTLLEQMKKYCEIRLTYLDDNNDERNNLCSLIRNCDSKEDIIKMINNSSLKEINKVCLKEIISFK